MKYRNLVILNPAYYSVYDFMLILKGMIYHITLYNIRKTILNGI